MDDIRELRIEDKLDTLANRIGNIDVTLAKQAVILEDHVKRSNMLEEKLAPIEKHVAMVHGVFKFIGVLGTLVGIVHGMLKLFGVY